RTPMFVTRPFDVAVTPDVVVWPLDGAAAGPRSFTVTVTNRARGPASTKVVLTPPPGWGGAVPSESLSFQREDEAKSFTVTLALPAVGIPIQLLGPDTLARGDLSRYDAIVIGSRAYETDPTLVAANGWLLDYARSGGLVIVQYQQYPFMSGSFAPYRLSIARP